MPLLKSRLRWSSGSRGMKGYRKNKKSIKSIKITIVLDGKEPITKTIFNNLADILIKLQLNQEELKNLLKEIYPVDLNENFHTLLDSATNITLSKGSWRVDIVWEILDKATIEEWNKILIEIARFGGAFGAGAEVEERLAAAELDRLTLVALIDLQGRIYNEIATGEYQSKIGQKQVQTLYSKIDTFLNRDTSPLIIDVDATKDMISAIEDKIGELGEQIIANYFPNSKTNIDEAIAILTAPDGASQNWSPNFNDLSSKIDQINSEVENYFTNSDAFRTFKFAYDEALIEYIKWYNLVAQLGPGGKGVADAAAATRLLINDAIDLAAVSGLVTPYSMNITDDSINYLPGNRIEKTISYLRGNDGDDPNPMFNGLTEEDGTVIPPLTILNANIGSMML